MNIPYEWILEIQYNILNKYYSFYCPFGVKTEQTESQILEDINIFVKSEFNSNFKIDKDSLKEFKSFAISIITHQVLRNMHPLTCGIDSNHKLLVPRIDSNKTCYLICPSCGWIQYNLFYIDIK